MMTAAFKFWMMRCFFDCFKWVWLSLMVCGVCGCSSVNKGGTQAASVVGRPLNVGLSGNVILPMVWIAPGTFTMGSPQTEIGRKSDEGPQTTVTISKGYWLGKTEVTVGQWKAVTGMGLRDKVISMLNDETLYNFNGKMQRIHDFMRFDNDPDKVMGNEDERLPMYFVSWSEAMDFCRKLNIQEKARGKLPAGYEYTLPTEAQWEFGCRASTNKPDTLSKVAWYNKNSAEGYTGRTIGRAGGGPRNVGYKQPNALGLQDMLGNLWEWCRDWYGAYPGGKAVDPQGPPSGGYRVNKGGSWGSGAGDERAANRAKNPPDEASAYRGFRLALCAVE